MGNREILIIKLSAIGDVVHTLPSLALLHRSFPEAKITWLVEEEASALISGHPCLNRVIVFKRKRWLSNLKHPSLWWTTAGEVAGFVRELRSTCFDLVIDFQGLLKSGVLVFLSRGRGKAGYDRSRELSSFFLNQRVPPVTRDIHAVERNLHLVRSLVVPAPGAAPLAAGPPRIVWRNGKTTVSKQPLQAYPEGINGSSIVLTEEEEGSVTALLRDNHLPPDSLLVTVHTQARWATKRWLPRMMAELADRLIEGYGARLIFTGAQGDHAAIGEIVGLMRHSAVNAAGRTTLKGLASLLKRSQLLITTDSGPMHIAAILGTPVVALFGPTAPWRTGPYTGRALIVSRQLFCSPCFKRRCEIHACMKEIPVAAVLAAVDRYLGTAGTPAPARRGTAPKVGTRGTEPRCLRRGADVKKGEGMRILVTGVAGFIGSHLAERLLREDHQVVGMDCFTDYYPRSFKESNLRSLLKDPGFSFAEDDLLTADLPQLLNDRDVVFHQAAQAGVRSSWGAEFEVYTSLNVLATQRLLEACKGLKISKFIYASSSSVYGDAKELPLREDSILNPVSPYGVTKLAGEHLCYTYCKNYQVPTISLRYFTVYGPRQRPDMAFHRFMRALIDGDPIEIYGDGTQTRDFTFISDIIDGNLLAMQNSSVGRVFNLGGGSRVALGDVLETIQQVAGKGAKIIHRDVQRGDVKHTLADTTTARGELAYRPQVDLRTGLEEQWKWFQENRF